MNVIEGYKRASSVKRAIDGCLTPEAICDALGIWLIRKDMADLRGMYKVLEKKRFIFLNSNMENEYEEAATLFHEIGHDQNPDHREKAKKSFLQDSAWSLSNNVDITEKEANIIAAHILLDDEEVIDTMKTVGNPITAAQNLNVHYDLFALKLCEMEKMYDLKGRSFPFDLSRLPREADPCFLKCSNGMLDEYGRKINR